MSRIRAVLFDKDGTLIDFDRSFASATAKVIAALAKGDQDMAEAMANAVELDLRELTFTPQSVIIAGTGNDITCCFAEVMGRTANGELERQIDQLFAVHTLESLAPFEASTPVVSALHERGLVLGIATNDAEENARQQARKMAIEHYMSFIAGYDSGHGGKPGPGMVLAFCEAQGMRPQETMLVGDSLHDMECARRAGAVAVAVTSGPATAEELHPHADHVIAGIWELESLL